jgi:type IV pilus assembly protein PilE
MHFITNKGFSLIELLTVLSIMTILAFMAYPSYTHYLTRAHRVEAQTALLDLAHRLEDYHRQTHTYQTATLGQGKPSDVLHSAQTPGTWYTLRIVNASENDYQLQAIPNDAQAKHDMACGTLTLTRAGEQNIMNHAGSPVTSCWS